MGGAGFLPSTVVLIWKVEMYLSHSHTASQISCILRFTTRGESIQSCGSVLPFEIHMMEKEGGSWCLHTPPGVTGSQYITNPNNALFVGNPSNSPYFGCLFDPARTRIPDLFPLPNKTPSVATLLQTDRPSWCINIGAIIPGPAISRTTTVLQLHKWSITMINGSKNSRRIHVSYIYLYI